MNRRQLEQLARLEQQVADLRGRTRLIPSTFPSAASARVYQIQVIGGNTLTSGAPGVKRKATQVNEASTIDPQTATSTPEGVGIGYLWIDGEQQFVESAGVWVAKRVLIIHDTRSQVPVALVYSDSITVSPTQISGGVISGYRPDYL